MRLLFVVLVVVVLAPVASAADGFTSRPAIAARVTAVTGEPITVYCADNAEAWSASLTDAGLEARGYAYVGSHEVFLPVRTCAPMILRLRAKAVAISALALSVSVVMHEAAHAAGIADEKQAECRAFKAMPRAARAWGFTKRATLNRFLSAARAAHNDMGAGYICG